jgi:hypothetical protein
MRPTLVRSAAIAGVLALSPLTFAATPVFAAVASDGVVACEDDADHSSGARIKKDHPLAKEPALYPAKDAKKYGLIDDLPTLADGSVTIDTVFHVIVAEGTSAGERTRLTTLVQDQMDVLNAAFSGTTSSDAADTPFRFALADEDLNFVENDAWVNVAPGKTERDMKSALREGDSETLNVYAADIGGGLLGWAYFPKGYNKGQDYKDGVVILDESMPGGDPEVAGPYTLGDTLVHEVGHWMMLEHTFAGGCSASGDGVADTPREAFPQFGCPVGADTCAAPGLDPINNFMDYTEDSCMNEFTPGQAARMSDAWLDFRAGGNG